MKSDVTKQGHQGDAPRRDAEGIPGSDQPIHFDWQRVARLVLLARKIDELEERELAPQGKTKLQLSSAGHELAQVLLGLSLDHPHDVATAYYRSRPLLLASGMTCEEALAASLAYESGPSAGRDVGVVFNLPRREHATILPASGNVGAQFTPAAGWAQSLCYRRETLGEQEVEGAIAVATGGDGSVATNGFWSALTIATTLKLPVLFLIEDNGYAISVPSKLQTPGGNIAANLASFQDLKVDEASGTDPHEAACAISRSLRYVRSGEGACLLRLTVPRLAGHAFTDKQHYKTEDQLAADRNQDPLAKLQKFLEDSDVLSKESFSNLEQEVQREVEDALHRIEETASSAPLPPTEHLFAECDMPEGTAERMSLEGKVESEGVDQAAGDLGADDRTVDLREAIHGTLESEMKKNERILIFGEDVGAYGGIHGVTRSLQESVGADRVLDTSLSEEGIIGRSIGLAIAGLMPVPELQFRKYADAGYEQMVDAGLVRWRTAGTFSAPMVVRIPVGCGKKGGDPWHSMSGEASYAHMLGWRIAMPSNAADAAGLLRTALRGDDPTLFLEHRGLLVDPRTRRSNPGPEHCVPFGKAALYGTGKELTVITWGEMVHRCMEAAAEFAEVITLIDLRTLIPWDRQAVVQSVRQTGRALVVHEDTVTAGFAGEVMATLASEAHDSLKAPLQRLCAADCPVPYNIEQMMQVIPSTIQIKEKMEELLRS